ncbi:FimD/PapC N-terminal domain-containing protein [Escherichia coli]
MLCAVKSASCLKLDFDVSTQSLALTIPQKGLVKVPENVDWDYGTSAFRVNYSAEARIRGDTTRQHLVLLT